MVQFRLIDQYRWMAEPAADLTVAPLAGTPSSDVPHPREPHPREPRGDPVAAPALLDPLAAFVARGWPLPSFGRRTHVPPDAALDATVPPALRRTLRALRSKLLVVNPRLVMAVPPYLLPRLRRLVGAYGARAHARGAGRLALSLYEPLQVVVEHDAHGGGGLQETTHDVRFYGVVTYRLVLSAAGAEHDAAPGALAAPAALAAEAAPGLRTARPAFWFSVGLLVPDAEVLPQMTPATALHYRQITGRLGAGTPPDYWSPELWERFQEPGRIVGCIHPMQVEHGMAIPARTPPRPTAEELLFGAAPGSAWSPLTPSFDRRLFVPPGYCLVRYYCWIELAIAEPVAREAAA